VLNACGTFVVVSCSMAEIHGCGDEAKKKAREDWLHSNRPGGTVTGQSSTKPLKPQARNHLQSKLQVMPISFPAGRRSFAHRRPTHRKSWVGWRTRARSPRRRTRRVVGAAAQPDEEEAAPLVAEEAVGEAATLDRPRGHTKRA
jgi:hypothetical protein